MKKSKPKHNKSEDDEENCDPDSISSSGLSFALSDILDKKAAVRIRGFTALSQRMSSHVISPELLADFCETLGTYGIKSIERGSPAEAAVAAHACELYAISAGPCDSFYQLVAPPCLRALTIATAGTGSGSGSASCLLSVRLLSVASFFCSENPRDAEAISEALKQSLLAEDVVQKKKKKKKGNVSPQLLLELLRAWNLVAPTAPRLLAAPDSTKSLAQSFAALLGKRETPTEVKAECLYGLALLFERLAREQDVGQTRKEERGSISGAPLTLTDVPEWLEPDVLREAWRDATCTAAKKDKAAEQRIFRQVCAYLLEGTQPPPVTMKIMRHKIVFEGWEAVYRLGVVTRILGGHLNTHLEHNAVLMDLFGYCIEPGAAPENAKRERDPERARMNSIARSRCRDFKASSMAWDSADSDDFF